MNDIVVFFLVLCGIDLIRWRTHRTCNWYASLPVHTHLNEHWMFDIQYKLIYAIWKEKYISNMGIDCQRWRTILKMYFTLIIFFSFWKWMASEKTNNMNLTSAYTTYRYGDPKPRPKPIRSELRTSNEDDNSKSIIIIIMHSMSHVAW